MGKQKGRGMGRAPAFRAGADGEEKKLVFLAGGLVPVQEGSFSSLGSLLAHKHTWECVSGGGGSPPFCWKCWGLLGILVVVYLPEGLTLSGL